MAKRASAKRAASRRVAIVAADPGTTQNAKEQSPQPGSIGARDLGLAACLVFATLAAYWPSLRGTMLWDDDAHVTRPALQSWHGLWRIWFQLGATQQYYPLLHSAFWAEHRLWGGSMVGYHLTNVLLHATAALLVVAILRELDLPGAWLAGFTFALHPVCVNSVAWISEQKSTLSAVLYLVSALVYLRFDQKRQRWRYVVALGLFVLALLAKSVTATLPAALLVILWWRRGRLEWRRDASPLLTWFALGASSGLFTAWIERKYIGAEGPDFALTMLQRCLLAGRATWFYLAKLACPSNLMFMYPHWGLDTGAWWQYVPLLGALAIAVGLWRVARWRRGPLTGFLYFTGTLFPVLGFLNVYPFVYSYVSDHFQYLASLGVIATVISGVTLEVHRAPVFLRRGFSVSATLLVATLAVLTWRQSTIYRDVETLYGDTLRRNPSSWMAENNLGGYLLDIPGRAPEGMAHLKTALRLKPDSAEAHYNLGKGLAKMSGHVTEAMAHYEAALRLRPKFAEAEDNLGVLLSKIPGRRPDAILHLQAALRIRPDFPDALINLGVVLSDVPGRLPEAISDLEAALRIDPGSAEAHNDLGTALSQLPDREEEAIAQFETALRISPNYVEAHNNLGSLLLEMPGRRDEAIAHFRAAIRINPGSAEAHMNLGKALSQDQRLFPEAISEYEAALRIDPHYGAAHNNLGVVLSFLRGGLPEAIRHFEAALLSDPNSAEIHSNLGNAFSELPGRMADAVAQYEAAVRVKPDMPEPHYLLGLALLKIPGRRAEAVHQMETAEQLRPDQELEHLLVRLGAARR